MTTFVTQVIIDNILTHNTSPEHILKLTQDRFKEKTTKIEKLKQGGIIFTPQEAKHIDYLQDIQNYPTNIYGTQLYIHTTKDNNNIQNEQPWLCINQVKHDPQNDARLLNELRQTLTERQDDTGPTITIQGLHRQRKGMLNSSLVKFKTTTDAATHYLLNNILTHQQRTLTIRIYIHKTQIQCMHCYHIGHTHKHCTNANKCVRCGENCPKENCIKDKKMCKL